MSESIQAWVQRICCGRISERAFSQLCDALERRETTINELRASIATERERADRAEHDCNTLSLDVQTLKAERDDLRERVARLEAALIQARLRVARYREAWRLLGETIDDAKRDLLGLKDKPIPTVHATALEGK